MIFQGGQIRYELCSSFPASWVCPCGNRMRAPIECLQLGQESEVLEVFQTNGTTCKCGEAIINDINP